MSKLLTVMQVARQAGRSKSSVHRDIIAGILPVTQTVPGYQGAFLIDQKDADRYSEAVTSGQRA